MIRFWSCLFYYLWYFFSLWLNYSLSNRLFRSFVFGTIQIDVDNDLLNFCYFYKVSFRFFDQIRQLKRIKELRFIKYDVFIITNNSSFEISYFINIEWIVLNKIINKCSRSKFFASCWCIEIFQENVCLTFINLQIINFLANRLV